MAPRNRLAGAGTKPPSAAVVKSHGRERRRKRPGEDQVRWQARRGPQGNHYGNVESVGTMSKPWGSRYHGTKLRRNLITGGAASGMRGGLSLPRRRLNGTWEPETPMLTEKPQVAEPQGESTDAETQGRNSV